MATDEMTVVERLKRLQGIANDHKIAHMDEDNQPVEPERIINELDEIRAGIGNIVRGITECLEDDLRDCGHCGSPFTFRRSDGDIGCYDCRGIMPREYRCQVCGETGTQERLHDHGHPPEEVMPHTKICPFCGEQGAPHELAYHDCQDTGQVEPCTDRVRPGS